MPLVDHGAKDQTQSPAQCPECAAFTLLPVRAGVWVCDNKDCGHASVDDAVSCSRCGGSAKHLVMAAFHADGSATCRPCWGRAD